ncbi:hypothetical protein ACYOEI_17200 [Singulisphaera rosea]
MARPRHTKKDIEEVVAYAESLGWRYIKPGKAAHIRGTLRCPFEDRAGCQIRVFSTPRNPTGHAEWIRAEVDKCAHNSS